MKFVVYRENNYKFSYSQCYCFIIKVVLQQLFFVPLKQSRLKRSVFFLLLFLLVFLMLVIVIY